VNVRPSAVVWDFQPASAVEDAEVVAAGVGEAEVAGEAVDVAVAVVVAAAELVDGDEAGGPHAASRNARHRAPETAMAEGAERCICSPESHETANNSSILDFRRPPPKE
jgi:hypothetical protein